VPSPPVCRSATVILYTYNE